MEGSLVAYKVFTNGSVLQASEVNDNLMKQAVATFSNAAARTAAITSPVEGQLSYLEDTNLYQHWNGSAWVSPFGLTHLNTTTFTAQTAVDISNLFSSAYDNYKFIVNCFQGGSGTVRLQARLLSGGTQQTTNYLGNQIIWNMNSGSSAGTTVLSNEFPLGFVGGGNAGSNPGNEHTFDLTRPFLPLATGLTGAWVGENSGQYQSTGILAGQHTTAASYDGIRFFPSASTITGIVRIYGYRNA